MTLRSVSYGGGVQSTALLVLAAQGRIDFPLFIFANVGDHAENPDTLAYLATCAMPFAARHDIELVERRWIDRTGRTRDLYDDLLRQENSLTIPLRDSGGFGNRKCTQRYKTDVVLRELRQRGASAESQAVVALGFSTDEIERVSRDYREPWATKSYPLDLGLSRADCRRIISGAGLPVPPKSSCWFCPFQRIEQWRELRRRRSVLFAEAVSLDATMRERHQRLRGDLAGLASVSLALEQAVDDQLVLDGMDGCDSGWCMT